jgi:hypothetical protein
MYGKCSAYGLLFVVAIWALPSFGGEYVTYTDPKTGVRYYGDALPPSAPSNVKAEVRRHEGVPNAGSHWTAAERNKADHLAVTAPKAAPQTPLPKGAMTAEQFDVYLAQRQRNDRARGFAEMEHRSNKPSEPGRGPVFRDFNRATNAWGKYEADMFEWRAQGRELRQQYNAPIGFGRNPTGFSREEKRYYKSYGR